ncbi:dicarboxylate/amino acid:cation symporter [Halothiobacillus neapolitanus]|uniref:Sodium:dicarboxylate symporter n=1 Tax=Halothiobacillus neapolitanus (strain ATCC 23641 / DSM 15147 / CIP 104769 / NCIMB 8539 / c2) TaxID=555778 RepID=D0KZR0_HALNC|nr:dicarboxylate/amino acid:cation symporter [Halothiobacillus neapolitanus]ACX95933.1 sodium:dicarboxylate symporter [Halothiobacillus neapolitanus c2]TDN66242.1 Na+/H+-dicarboxylate symporter [Halothiobacillus neapolitanus]
MSATKKLSLTSKVLIGMGLGIAIGLLINMTGLNVKGGFVNTYVVDGLFYVMGKLFINALKMLVVPLVFFSLLSGVCGIGNLKILGRVGTKSFALYILTTAIAIAVAIIIATSAHIGLGMNLAADTSFTTQTAPPLTEVLIGIIPTNPLAAMAQGQMLPLIFFTILLGVSIVMVGTKAKGIVAGIEVANEIMMKMVTLVMVVAPYAVFALIAKSMAELGLDLLGQLAGYVIVLVSALLVHLFFTLMIILKTFSGLSPREFMRKIREAQIFAFSTASSNATIPVTLRVITEKMGVDNSVASFTVPFGATINMDGTAIMQGVATVFIANIYGIDLGITGYLTVIMMSVLASIGTAGVPGVGLIMLSMVFYQVGLPVEGIGLILGVDRLMDMIRTAVNISGDAVVSAIVANSEQKLDQKTYNDPQAGLFTQAQDLEIDHNDEKELAKIIQTAHDRR